MAEVNGGNENKHDFYPLKPTDESGDCEQCGWHASATSVKVHPGPRMSQAALVRADRSVAWSTGADARHAQCKVCGIISHEGCRALLTSPCATAGTIRLSYRYEPGG